MTEDRILFADEPRIPDAYAALLVGGESRRMGAAKAMLPVGGVPLYRHIARRLAPAFGTLRIVGFLPEPPRANGFAHVEAVPDRLPGRSSLNGAYSALCDGPAPWAALFACDAPDICLPLLHFMASLRAEGFAAVLAADDAGRIQPFHGFWRTSVAAHLAAAARLGDLSLMRFLSRIAVRVAEPSEWRVHDPEGRFLVNLNTPDAFAAYDRG